MKYLNHFKNWNRNKFSVKELLQENLAFWLKVAIDNCGESKVKTKPAVRNKVCIKSSIFSWRLICVSKPAGCEYSLVQHIGLTLMQALFLNPIF